MTKHEPAFPIHNDEAFECQQGMTKYEEVAARFMAAILGNAALAKLSPPAGKTIETMFLKVAFDSADAFFAELEKRGAK